MHQEYNTRGNDLNDGWCNEHLEVTVGEKAVLRLRASGMADAEIMDALGLKFTTLRSRLRRFSDRTGLTHFRLVTWCASHIDCCLAEAV